MDLAQLGIRVQTAEVKSGAEDLDQLTTAAGRAKGAVDKLGPSSAAAGQGVRRITDGARTVAPALKAQSEAFKGAGISAGQYNQALRLVPAQITDIVTGLVSGQSPFIVAIQQGGQLRDSFGGFGNTLRGLATILTPTRLALGGVAGVAGILATSFAAGQRESFEFAKAIALSGNAAGVTESKLRSIAQAINGIAGTEAQAANVLNLLTTSGRVAGDNLERLATIALKVERTIGTPVEETVKQFAELGRNPVAASKKLNEQYNFLTASVLAQIRALEEQGAASQAAELAQNNFGDALDGVSEKVAKNLGIIQQLGQAISDGFAISKNALLSIGRDDTAEQKLSDLQERLEDARKNPVTSELFGDSIESLEAQIEAQEKIIFNENIQAGIAASRVATQRLLLELEEDEAKKKKELAAQAEQIRKAQFGAGIADIKRALEGQLDAFANSENELDALRAAGLVKDQEFFDRKRKLIEDNTAAQVSALQQQNERLRAENSSGVAQIMNQQMIRDNEAEIQRLRAASISQLKILETQQDSATRKLTQQYDDAKRSAGEFLETLDRTFSRELELQGAGDKARQRQGEVDRIRDQFDSQRRQLDREARRDPSRAAAIDQERKIIDETELQALERLEGQFDKLDDRAADFVTGAREAFNNYLDDLKNVSAQSEQLFTSAFRGAEDALVEFVTTGKLNFKDLANSILQDLIRIQIRALIVRAIAGSGALGGLLGGGTAGAGAGVGGGFGGGLAAGGPVSSGRTYLVGEEGPELFVPRSNGNIIPSKQTMQLMRGGAAPNVTINQSFTQAAGSDPLAEFQRMQQIEQRTVQAVRRVIADDLRRGRFDGALQGAQR